MQVTNEFSVGAAPDRVYETLLDFERVGPCMPGATVGAALEDGSHPAEIAVRLGPMRLSYRGVVRLAERDPAQRRATLEADVREVRGQGTARARMSMSVTGEGQGARVASTTEIQLSGRAAQMGAGIVQDVAGRLVADMAANLERLLDDQAQRGGTPGGAAPTPESAESAADRPVPGGTREEPAPARRQPTPSGESPPPRRASQTAARPIGGLRLLLEVLWRRLWRYRGRSATPTR